MRFWPVIFCLILVGCSGPQSGSSQYRQYQQSLSPAMPADQMAIRQALESQYQRWHGVPYRLGGTSRAGVDCSAFTQLTYRDQFNRQLPRTTEAQAQQGIPVDLKMLQAGDLVFFKTDIKVRHVGIYMGAGEFLHASTSRGVMVSRLNNPYWQRHYWQARRLY